MKKRIVALLLAAGMVMGCMTGCGQEGKPTSSSESEKPVESSGKESVESTPEATPEPKEPVTLEWYYRGNGVQQDTEAVEERVNELIKEYPGLEHVTVNMNPYTADNYKQGVLLAQTSGKQIDILNTVGLDYVGEIKNGTYIDLKPYLETEEYSDLYGTLPEWLWGTMEYENGYYIVPNYQGAGQRQALRIPAVYEDLCDLELLEDLMIGGLKTIEDIEALATEWEEILLAIRKEKEKDTQWMFRLPLMYKMNYGIGGYKDYMAGGFVSIFEGTDTVVNIFETEGFKKCCEIQAEWYEKGLVPADILSLDANNYWKENCLNDEAIPIMFEQVKHPENGIVRTKTNGGIDVIDISLYDSFFMLNGWAAGGNGVTASCENPEEALLFLELINTGTDLGIEVYNTIVYGLEGEHYEKIDETHIKTLEYDSSQGGTETSYAAMKWIIGNTFNAYLNQSCNDGDNEIAIAINENPNNLETPIMGMQIDLAPIETEISQCGTVVAEYQNTLLWGAKGAEWEAYYEEFIDKLKTAGAQKIVDEMQAQYDAWKATK